MAQDVLLCIIVVHCLYTGFPFDSDVSTALEDINLENKECGTVQINDAENKIVQNICVCLCISLCMYFQSQQP